MSIRMSIQLERHHSRFRLPEGFGDYPRVAPRFAPESFGDYPRVAPLFAPEGFGDYPCVAPQK